MTTSEQTFEYHAMVSNWIGNGRSERKLGSFASAELAKELCQKRSGRLLKWAENPHNIGEWWSDHLQYEIAFHVVPVIVSESVENA